MPQKSGSGTTNNFFGGQLHAEHFHLGGAAWHLRFRLQGFQSLRCVRGLAAGRGSREWRPSRLGCAVVRTAGGGDAALTVLGHQLLPHLTDLQLQRVLVAEDVPVALLKGSCCLC